MADDLLLSLQQAWRSASLLVAGSQLDILKAVPTWSLELMALMARKAWP